MRFPGLPPAHSTPVLQTEEEATVNLNAINQLAQQQGRAPWSLSFSFGRSLQVGGCGLFFGAAGEGRVVLVLTGLAVRPN